jgi:hypothetical protein
MAQPKTPLQLILQGAMGIFGGKDKAPQQNAFQAPIGANLNPTQTKVAYDKFNTKPISKPQTLVQKAGGFIKNEFTPQNVEVRRAFEKTPVTKYVPPIVAQAGAFGFSLLEAIPRAIATVEGEAKGKLQPNSVNVGIDLRRLGYDKPQYVTASKEQEDAINNGENPWLSGLRIVSQKALDVAFGASLVTDLFKLSTKILLSGGPQAKIEAQNVVDAYKINSKSAFQRLKNSPLAEREQVMAEMTNVKNQAEKVLKEQGKPTALDKARVGASRYTELLGRETPITKDYWRNITKPDIGLKDPIAPKPVLDVPQLPGTRERPGQAPAFGLSSKEMENVGKADLATTQPYKETGNLTTKILKDLEGKTTVSKQYILDATNRGELKQVERDIVRQVLDDMTSKRGTRVFSGASEITPEWSNDKISNFGTIFRGKNELGGGIYVTDAPEYAKTFGSKITESSLNPNLNLFDIRESSATKIGKEISTKIKNGFDNYDWYIKNGGEEILPTDLPEDVLGKIQNVYGANSTDILKKAGFDGIVGEESRFVGGQGGTVWNIFDAKNIKTGSSDTINVKEFADKVKSELLPLKTSKQINPRYEHISLPSELRGNVKNYAENVYESPIKTSAGDVHFPSYSSSSRRAGTDEAKNYFGHTRIEDMADNKTRRVIEVQSDLYQKGNLEREGATKAYINKDIAVKYDELAQRIEALQKREDLTQLQRQQEVSKTKRMMEEIVKKSNEPAEIARKKELSKLQQYNDPTAHFRMVREEIKKASQDGKTKLQFPTGETAMKIEGLGDAQRFTIMDVSGIRRGNEALTIENMKVGTEVYPTVEAGDNWIITDVLGDGKFKAVPKSTADMYKFENGKFVGDVFDNTGKKSLGELPEHNKETFDISGKVDTNNPIYKFYEKDVQKYLNKFGGKEVVDDKGVSWIEVPIKKEFAKAPVEAFKLSPNKKIDFKATMEQIQSDMKKIFGKNIPIEPISDISFMGDPRAVGELSNGIIKLLTENGSVSDLVAKHEAWHYFKRILASNEERAIAKNIEDDIVKAFPKKYKALKEAGYTKDRIAEEMVADEFARYYRTGRTFSEKVKAFFDKILQRLELLIKHKSKLLEYFKNIRNRVGEVLQKDIDTPSFKLDGEKQIKPVDRLIAEGKIRVVSRNNRDVYQTKQGGEWVNARDEDSAVAKVTPKVKTPINLPEKLAQESVRLEFKKESLDNNPAKQLVKFMNKRTGELPEVLGGGKSKFGRKGDDIVGELGFKDSEQARQATQDYLKEKKAFIEEQKVLKDRIKEFKTTPVIEKKAISPIQKSTAEVKSIEKQAQQALAVLNEPSFPKDVSLPKIISDTVTPVEKKVHIIDTYLTTPSKVMEKIGFGAEARELRIASDDYWKELPKNIDKITAWAKRVPESNTKIFKYLDGQEVKLNDKELIVAREIKSWLKEWADRLELQDDNRISNYITHIFEKDSQKEFDEEMAKMISDKIPGSVYDPFIKKRLGARGYKEDTWQALSAYVKRATRKVHFDPILEKIQSRAGSSLEVSSIEKSQFKYIQEYINNINMRPSDFDSSIDNAIKSIVGGKLGQRPYTVILRTLRRATFRGMLGGNLSSSLRNLSQGVNTYATLGEKYTVIGYSSLFKKSAMQELEREGILNAGFIQDKVLSATGKLIEKADEALFAFFNGAEKISRGSAYFGGKAKFNDDFYKALADSSKRGAFINKYKSVLYKYQNNKASGLFFNTGKNMVEELAIEYGKEVVRKTQFLFDAVDTPVGLSSDTAKTLFQFQTYTTKQIEFLVGMMKDKNFVGLLRYALAGVAFVYTIGKAFGMQPKELLPIYRVGVPASLKAPVEVTKAILNSPDKFGNKRTLGQKAEDVGKSLVGLIPGGSQAKKIIQGIQTNKQGGSFTSNDKLQFESGLTPVKKAQNIIFGKYASNEAQTYFNKKDTNTKEIKQIKPIYEQIQKLKDNGKETEALDIYKGLSDTQIATYQEYKKKLASDKAVQGKKDILPKFQAIRKLKDEGKDTEAINTYNALTDEEKGYYQSVKKSFDKNNNDQTTQDDTKKTAMQFITDYARALAIDPSQAFKAIVTKEQLGKVEGNLVGFKRFYGKPFNDTGGSEEYVYKMLDEMGIPASERSSYNLEHIIPITVGGDNSPDNLEIIDRATHDYYTKFDIALGNALKSKKINRKRAEKIAKDFKSKKITEEEFYQQIK